MGDNQGNLKQLIRAIQVTGNNLSACEMKLTTNENAQLRVSDVIMPQFITGERLAPITVFYFCFPFFFVTSLISITVFHGYVTGYTI